MFRNKYRPNNFEKFIGNKSVVKSVKGSLEGGAQVFLFHGERGIGKTTIARIIANMVGADNKDVYEVNASNSTGVDDARLLEASAQASPLFGKSKVFIIDEMHRMSTNAQDSLLKIFEEPPKGVFFILCTTNPNKIISTIRSRTFEYHLEKARKDDIAELLDRVCKKEKIRVNEKVLQLIIKNCDGIFREALTLLEKVKDLDKKEAIRLIKKGSDEDTTVKEICQSLTNRDNWKSLSSLLKEFDGEPEALRRAIFGYLGAMADNASKVNNMALMHDLQNCFSENTYDNGIAGLKNMIRDAFLLMNTEAK